MSSDGTTKGGLVRKGESLTGADTLVQIAAQFAHEPPRPEPTDSARLEWLLYHISGKELRRLGVIVSSGGLAWGRPAVDRAMGMVDMAKS